MNPEEFTKLEYNTLREEIRETKNRIFKLAAVALIGLPTVSAAAEVLKIDILVLVLPGFIVATIFLYLSESSALMRCGTYIKHHIEPDGHWEHWLAEATGDHENRRRVDKMASGSLLQFSCCTTWPRHILQSSVPGTSACRGE